MVRYLIDRTVVAITSGSTIHLLSNPMPVGGGSDRYSPAAAGTRPISSRNTIFVIAAMGFPGRGVTDSVLMLFIPNQPSIASGINSTNQIYPAFCM